MSDFQTSSHRERWIFHPQDLIDKWTGVNRRSAETLAQYGTTRLKVDPVDGSISNPEPAPDHVVGSFSVKPLSCEEEQMMRIFYEQKIQELALAALYKSNDALKVLDFERYLESVFSRQRFDCPVEQFVQIMNAINYTVDRLQILTQEDMKHADRKLRHCIDEHKKKEKKPKHKSKRTASDARQ